jgi:hypothetical protein
MDGAPVFVPLTSSESGRPSGVLLGLHRPRRGPDGAVTFEFSLQNDDQTFRRRPAAVWAEVTPVRGDAAGAPYVFTHRGFVPGTPVPVVRCTAADWPADAGAARVRFWCSDAPVPPAGTIDLAEILAAPARPVPGLAGVQFEAYAVDEASAFRFDVVEHHLDGGPDVGALEVDWVGPAPAEIVERFDAPHGVVLHTFRFDRASVATPTGSLAVTPRGALGGGLRLDVPAVVAVPGEADLLVPFRAPGSPVPTIPAGEPGPAGSDPGEPLPPADATPAATAPQAPAAPGQTPVSR